MLPDDASVRILTCEPPLADPGPVVAALEKLFVQFQREGRCEAHEIRGDAGGRALVIAWTGAATLSGCSHDKINAVVTAFAPQALSSPPILIEGACVMKRELTQRIAAGTCPDTTPWWDVRVTTLGAWRAMPVPLRGSWLWP